MLAQKVDTSTVRTSYCLEEVAQGVEGLRPAPSARLLQRRGPLAATISQSYSRRPRRLRRKDPKEVFPGWLDLSFLPSERRKENPGASFPMNVP